MYALIDSQGKVAGRTAYDPYGNITYQTGTQPIMAYAGLYKHDASGLYLATYRAYNPATARWLNRDPIREAGGLNVYAYVNGDPVSKLDVNGLSPTVGIPIGSFGFGGATTGIAQDSYKQSSLINEAVPTSLNGPFGPVCGAEGSVSASWIPDGIWKDACQLHDRCYETCSRTRFECDAEFLFYSGNTGYVIFVRILAGSAYEAAQAERGCNGECKK